MDRPGGRIARDPQDGDKAWCERQRQLYQHDWVVYAKTPLGGPAQVLEYLRRYTQRTAFGNERIRHYGLLAPCCKAQKLAAARLALHMPVPKPQASESAQAFVARVAQMDVDVCPCCKAGRLRVTAVLLGQAHLPSPQAPNAPPNRGPP